MILSDRTIRDELAAGRIVIDPLDETCIQPSSVDLHLDRLFRVFRNHTMGHIDVKQSLEDLTELVTVEEDEPFMLHPGEFVLGSTSERVALPDDLVARLEGKSSLGRLGLLIHSSLPGNEPVLVRPAGSQSLEWRPIGELVTKGIEADVVSFDPETLDVGFHAITGWYEGPADRIYEIRLASGRSVRVTAGHNVFTLDRDGRVVKLRTLELQPGARIAVPRSIPEPGDTPRTVIHVLSLIGEHHIERVVVEGPGVSAGWDEIGPDVDRMLRSSGLRHVDHYRKRGRLPLAILKQLPELANHVGAADRVLVRGGRNGVPAVIALDEEFAWLVGLYVAEGSRRRTQVTISNTDQVILDRAQAVFARLGLDVYRAPGAITVSSSSLSILFEAMEMGDRAWEKRVPRGWLGLEKSLLHAFLAGLVDGDGSVDTSRTSVWTSSPGLVSDLLVVAARLGKRAGSCHRDRSKHGLHQVYFPHREHKLLTAVPLPDRLLIRARESAGLDQLTASRLAGYRHPTDLNNIERRSGRDAVRLSTLRRLTTVYAGPSDEAQQLQRITNAGLQWDEVVEVIATDRSEPIYDIEVRPSGRHIENFVAGSGGVFVSNTAGFVDAGWDGHLTLELSNVANLPITLYPGMKIGQISFLRMTTPADNPYGSTSVGSKYQGQRGPTPSRYFENFR